MNKLKGFLNKTKEWIKSNKFLSFVIGLILVTLISQALFADSIFNIIVEALPIFMQDIINTILILIAFFLMIMTLFLFGAGIFNAIRDVKDKEQLPESSYSTYKKIALYTSIVGSIVITYFIYWY